MSNLKKQIRLNQRDNRNAIEKALEKSKKTPVKNVVPVKKQKVQSRSQTKAMPKAKAKIEK